MLCVCVYIYIYICVCVCSYHVYFITHLVSLGLVRRTALMQRALYSRRHYFGLVRLIGLNAWAVLKGQALGAASEEEILTQLAVR